MRNLLTTIEQKDSRPWICAVSLLLIAYPMWLWNVDYQTIVLFAEYILFYYAYRYLSWSKSGMMNIIAFALQLMIIAINSGAFQKNINGVILYFISAIAFIPIFFSPPEFWRKILDCFIKLLGVLLIFALAEHLLFVFSGVHLVRASYSECQANPDRMYEVYLFNVYLLNVDSISIGGFKRFFAFFNEPGELGTFVAALLFTQRLDLKKWYNIVFLISGLLSFSMAFIIAIAIWYILYGSFKEKNVSLILSLVVFTYFYNNEILYNFVFRRFELGEDMMFYRENMKFNEWVSGVHLEDYLFLPYQNRSLLEYATTWRWAFIFYGVVPCVAYLLALVLSRIKSVHSMKDITIGIVLVLIIFVQRPFLQSYIYVLLMVSVFLYFGSSNNQAKNIRSCSKTFLQK